MCEFSPLKMEVTDSPESLNFLCLPKKTCLPNASQAWPLATREFCCHNSWMTPSDSSQTLPISPGGFSIGRNQAADLSAQSWGVRLVDQQVPGCGFCFVSWQWPIMYGSFPHVRERLPDKADTSSRDLKVIPLPVACTARHTVGWYWGGRVQQFGFLPRVMGYGNKWGVLLVGIWVSIWERGSLLPEPW